MQEEELTEQTRRQIFGVVILANCACFSLLFFGADYAARFFGEEQLSLAAVKVAAGHGVNLNHSDFSGSTALHDAAARRLPNIVRELAERGADINALNAQNRTPLDLAIAAEARPNFFGFNLVVPGASASEVLEEFGAEKSSSSSARSRNQ